MTRFLLLATALAVAGPALAQETPDDVFGGFGTATTVEGVDEAPPRELREGEGAVRGQVLDAAQGNPIASVTVILVWPAPADGSPPRQDVTVTDAGGAFEFVSVPAGEYDLSFVKSGYRASAMTGFAVEAGEVTRADFPLPPVQAAAGEVLHLDAFVVEAATVAEMMTSLELRMDSDSMLNVMSAEDFSKYAASDVAEVLKRVAGVNVVEGQFAIIRGLEDRYSSTLYNGAVIPSPDPDRQSPQLDLFASEIVSDLVVAKTFAPGLPSNSSGGAIDILTHDYPEEFEISVKSAVGFNEKAVDRFLKYQSGSAFGKDVDWDQTVDGELGATIGGRFDKWGREFRFKAVGNWELDHATAEGWQEGREPRLTRVRRGQVEEAGDLSLGELGLSDGRFDLTTSARSEQGTVYGGFGFDIDEDGAHRIDSSVFYTKKQERVVQLRENGYFPNLDYEPLREKELDGEQIDFSDFDDAATLTSWIARSARDDTNDFPSRGSLWFTHYGESRSFKRDRDLLVTQVNGVHEIDWLQIDWATNYAKTTQKDLSQRVRYFIEPDDRRDVPSEFPVLEGRVLPGVYVANAGLLYNSNRIEEDQGFGRLDLDANLFESVEDLFGVSVPVPETLEMSFQVGGWYEHASRDVDSEFLESPTVDGSSQFGIIADTPLELGLRVPEALATTSEGVLQGLRDTVNHSTRDILATHLGLTTTFFEDVDLLTGVRFENIQIKSKNDPFTGELAFDDSPAIFPSKYLLFDRLDNPTRSEVLSTPPAGTTFNDQLVGIAVPVDFATTNCDPRGETRGCVDLPTGADIEALVNGEIDDSKVLPAVGLTYRPIEGMAVRGAWSRTVARPSFREMSFYVSTEPGSDDLIVGNPQLGLSDVESYDGRIEYAWGELGDLVAFSAFYKTIEDPIESIVIRNPINFEESSSALFRTFFNNPSEARLWGIEVEARKAFDFIGWDPVESWARYFSIGGNFTWIQAEVDRIEAEVERAEPFFGMPAGQPEPFNQLKKSRRLFGQPEWIANADLSFDHPDWGTRITLAWFAISDVLDAAGSVSLGPDGSARSATIDRYVGEFYTLDLIVGQEFELPHGTLGLKFRVKNLTDSKRRIVYDPYQTDERIPERSFRVGRDYKLTLTYTF